MAHSPKDTLTQRRAAKPRIAAKPRKPEVPSAPPPAPRADTKQAKVVAMLRRPGGATIANLAKATGWQHHTVRGVIAGALKKKLGIAVFSEKPQGEDRVYRLR